MNAPETKPMSREEVIDLASCNARGYNFFSAIPKITGPAGLLVMGGIVANDFSTTGRVDLLVGGSLMVLLGAGIVDINAGKNYLSRAFSKVASFVTQKSVTISQPFILAASGLASCIVLGGGEFANFLRTSGVTISDLIQNKQALQDFMATASYPKIMANVVPFLAASMLDVPSVRAKLDRMIDPGVTQATQNILSAAGGMMISHFALRAGLPVVAVGTAFQTFASMVGLGAVFHKTFAPQFFMPDLGKTPDEERLTLERIEASGHAELFHQTYVSEMQQRGNRLE